MAGVQRPVRGNLNGAPVADYVMQLSEQMADRAMSILQTAIKASTRPPIRIGSISKTGKEFRASTYVANDNGLALYGHKAIYSVAIRLPVAPSDTSNRTLVRDTLIR